jgi:hypothetical protein
VNLYICNPTSQHQVFMYREPENTKLIIRDIPAGNQLKIYEGTEDAVKAIVRQHEHYGLKKASERMSRSQVYTSLVWNDKPISFDDIKQIVENNKEVVNDNAAEDRRKLTAAVAVKTQEMQAQSESKPQSVEVSVVEKGTKGEADKPVQTLQVKSVQG